MGAFFRRHGIRVTGVRRFANSRRGPAMRGREESFADYIRRLMIERRVKGKDLAKAAGIPATTLSAIMQGREPRLETAEKIMGVLGVRMTTLGEDEKKAAQVPELLRQLADSIELQAYTGYVTIGGNDQLITLIRELTARYGEKGERK